MNSATMNNAMKTTAFTLLLCLTVISGCTTVDSPKKADGESTPRERYHPIGRLGL